MKKLLFISGLAFTGILSAQTAVNFNANDCASVNHDLFSELNAGKVVVITWVMPCSTCIGPTLSAENEVQNFLASNPGKIYHYIADDYANTSCSTLNNWCVTNGIVNSTARFSSGAINMNDYGSVGMPKTVIIAGLNHTVFYNEDNTLTVANFNAAMNSALAAANAVGLKKQENESFKFSVFPNPVNEQLNIKYSAKENSDAIIEVFNSLGETIESMPVSVKAGADNNFSVPSGILSEGLYFIKINNASFVKFIVSRN